MAASPNGSVSQRISRSHTGRIQSAQYGSIRFTERLAEAGVQPSVGAVGSSYDNAHAEPINGLYKTELIKPRKPLAHHRLARVIDSRDNTDAESARAKKFHEVDHWANLVDDAHGMRRRGLLNTSSDGREAVEQHAQGGLEEA